MVQRILVLEDDPNLLRLYIKVLSKTGYAVDSTRSLQEANAMLSENTYTIFICDMQVEDGNSSSLLRRHWAALKQVGTHVMIVSGEEKYRMLTTDFDVDFFLSKPVSPHDLIEYINRVSQTGGV